LLYEESERLGLTAICPEEAPEKHYLDSLAPLWLLGEEFLRGKQVVDVGSGGGFPGLVLAVAVPSASFVLVESSTKRASFLEGAVRAMGLNNVEVAAKRAEEIGKKGMRESFDVAVCRALAELRVALELCIPLVKVGGYFIAYKGPKASGEIETAKNALRILGARIREVKTYSLPQTGAGRCLVVVEKVSQTPGRFPRKPGIPEKRPL